MEGRQEPRFSIYSSVKVSLLSRPERALDCVLLDISATGLKLIAPENIPPDEILSIEAEDHLALVDVRHSQPRGDKFTIGCERIHVLNKVSLPDEPAKAEQIRLLIEDYRSRVRDGIATPRPDANEVEVTRVDHQITAPSTVAVPPPAPVLGSFSTREQLLGAAVGWVVEHWDELPASTHAEPGGRTEIIDRLTFHLADKLRANAAPPETARKFRLLETGFEKIKAWRWRLPTGLAIAAVLGWGVSAIFWSFGSSGAAKQAPLPPVPVSAVRHAQIKIIEPTSLLVTSDGKRLFNKKFSTNDVREIDFSHKLLLQVGNAKGVEIILDGKPIGRIGGRGQSRLVELSADGFRLLP